MADKILNRDYFVDRLYKEELKRLDSGERKKDRVKVDSAQGKTVIQKCGGKCVLECGLLYAENPHGFDIHHINGDPEDTRTQNLTLMCKTCHGTIHGDVGTKIANYKAKMNKKNDAGTSKTSKKPVKQKIVSVDCSYCGGRGALSLFQGCPSCHGEGTVQVYYPPEKCTVCKGSGKDPDSILPLPDPCRHCHGTGYQNVVKITRK
ncbi:HNH endonuclease [Methanofollis liminatans DSM 4140]|uniref:HNH endonuclease n=1 Tax=Methanofollis liminatans DSM 4140 TaxID=28892 RepID=J0S1B9_9EURY|nr:hypothetical protein [Methanofollis liminatans]EJG07676.1 HNH endonuclease [Methanofollis liminatans DSM 4140]